MLLVQQYLLNHTFLDLEKEFGIYASFSKCGSFWSMNYNQLESRESDLISQQCRGVILAKANHSSLLNDAVVINNKISYSHVCPADTVRYALPFFRFFNEGQGAAASIDWQHSNTKIYNKADGTCIIVWFHPIKQEWKIATRGSPEADVPLDSNKNLTFSSLFKQTLSNAYNLSFEDFTSDLDKNNTYIFELCSVYNRIVVSYPTSQIFFIGARCTSSMKEFFIEDDIFKKQIKVPHIQSYQFNNLSNIIDWVSSKNPLEYEGVVVRDPQFNRIKIKNAQYVAFSRARDSLGTSDRNCLELILAEKDDDIVSALPQEIVNNLLKIKEGYRIWLERQQSLYETILAEANSILPKDKKTFALTVQKYKPSNSGAFFTIFNGKADNMKDYVAKARKAGTWSDSFLDNILESINRNSVLINEFYAK